MHLNLFRKPPAVARPPQLPADWLCELRCQALDGDAVEYVADLSGIAAIGSLEIGELIVIQLTLRQAGRNLVLTNVPPFALEILETTRLDRLIEIRQTEPLANS